MIGKTIRTFDNILPVEDPQKLMNIINECRKHPSLEERADFSEERETLEALGVIINGMIAKYQMQKPRLTYGEFLEAMEEAQNDHHR